MSSEKKIPVMWCQKCVGFILNLKCDNFDVYGKWQPNQNSAYKEFLELLETYGEAEVEVGNNEPKMRGTVEIVPDEEIDIKVRMNT
jgi:hypothetical protein